MTYLSTAWLSRVSLLLGTTLVLRVRRLTTRIGCRHLKQRFLFLNIRGSGSAVVSDDLVPREFGRMESTHKLIRYMINVRVWMRV